MSRFVTDFTINQPDDFIQFISQDFFAKEGFILKQYKTGEAVWSKGDGVFTSPQFIKLTYGGGQVHLEAWMAVFAFPGLPLGETGLTGFWGWAVKRSLRSRVDSLIALLRQDVQIPAAQVPGSIPDPARPPEPQPIPVQVHDPSGKAVAGFVLGLVSLAAWLIPLAGVFCSIIGIFCSRVGRASSKRGLATAGLILSIIGLVAAVLLWGLNLLFTLMYLTF